MSYTLHRGGLERVVKKSVYLCVLYSILLWKWSWRERQQLRLVRGTAFAAEVQA
jgi:hypothetical protein